MSESCLKQIRYWTTALRQTHKAIRRRNKYLNRLLRENAGLHEKIAQLQARIAEDELGK